MTNLESCLEYLESVGADVFDVGCNWQDNSPMTLAEKSDVVTGLFLITAQVLLLYVVTELLRSKFKER